MRVRIRTSGFRLFLPLPVSMIGFAVKLLPDKLFEQMRAQIPAPYNCLLTKENTRVLAEEFLDMFKKNKGLEIVHVEARDGTFVSVRL